MEVEELKKRVQEIVLDLSIWNKPKIIFYDSYGWKLEEIEVPRDSMYEILNKAVNEFILKKS
jgi:hypothetical protein